MATIFPLCTAWRRLGAQIPRARVVVEAPIGLKQRISRSRRVRGFQPIHTTSRTGCKPEDQSVFDLSLQLSQRPMNGNASMPYTRYHSHSSASRVSHMTKLEVAERYGLSPRDLRVFDQPSGGLPHILVREQTILVQLFDLRVLVQHDQALLFHVAYVPGPDHAQGSEETGVSRVFSHIMEGRLRGNQRPGRSTCPPYELWVLEAGLASVTSVLEAEYLLTEQQVFKALQMVDSNMLNGEESLIHSELRTILDLKRKLVSIEQRARQVRTMTQEVLNDDEDMANMHLTDKQAGKPHEMQDHQDVEYLFEAYFKTSNAIGQEVASLMSHIRRTEETIQYTLNVRRNQIMVLEARLEILMLALAGATLIAGWYGMNVINYFEESPHAFAVIVLVSCAAVLSSSWFGMQRLRRIRRVRLQI